MALIVERVSFKDLNNFKNKKAKAFVHPTTHFYLLAS